MRRPSFSEVLAALPVASQTVVLELARAAEARRAPLHLVGGPVRDFLLQREVRDVDLVVATQGLFTPAQLVQDALGRAATFTEHARFGTLALDPGSAGGTAIDLAMARSEDYAHPGALPRVEPASIAEDLVRRDFSVNALAIELRPGEPERRGSVLDPGSGLADLAARRLRIFHAQSFHDDPTRALRAARLAPRLGFSLTRSTRTALNNALRDGALGRVSGDRLRAEIEKVFADAPLGLSPPDALRRLSDWHVLPALEPGLELPRESRAPLRRLGRALTHPPWEMQRFRPWVAGLFLWLAPLAPALRRRVLRRFAVRGDVAERVTAFPKACQGWGKQLDRARGRGAVDALLGEVREDELLALYASAAPTLRRRIVRFAAEDRHARLPIGGRELRGLGIEGADVGRALARVRAAVLDGQIANREEALALAREHVRRRRR